MYTGAIKGEYIMWDEWEKIIEFADANGLRIERNEQGDCLDIESLEDRWKIYLDDRKGRMYLFHKNVWYPEDDSLPFPGYHRQMVYADTVLGYLNYIVSHDLFRKGCPLKERWDHRKFPKGSKNERKQRKLIHRQELKASIRRVEAILEKN